MNRRTAILVGAMIAILAAVEAVVLSGFLSERRRDDRARYDRAITAQRRSAGHMTHSVVGRSEPARATLCVRGVDTFAKVLERALGNKLMTAEKHLDVEGLRELSNRAVRAERYVEQASAGPALPQRMGRTRVADARSGESNWHAIQPARVNCNGADAFALFRMDIERAPAGIPVKPFSETH
jgi:hypothetical protein